MSSLVDTEESQADELEKSFRDGKVQDAFVRAMHLQQQSKRVDFFGRLCALVAEPVETWLHGCDRDTSPLTMPVKMLLMLSLARQLEDKGLPDSERAKKIEWINELWFAFDPQDAAVTGNSASLCTQLTEVLDRVDTGAVQLRRLKGAVKMTAKLLEKS